MEKSKNNEKLYRLIQTIAIVGMFVSVALVIMMGFEYIKYSSGMLALVLIILVVSVCCMMTLPWVKVLSKSEFKILCYVMFGLIGISFILWAIDIVVAINLIDAAKASNSNFNSVASLNFLKISLILTFQVVVATLVASCAVKYRKTMLIFQVITYISNAFIDFYGSYALACIKITKDGINFVGNTTFLTNKITVMFAVMALAFVIISNWIVKRMDKRKQRDALDPMYEDIGKKSKTTAPASEGKSVQAQLKELKSLLDQNLITEEEYAKKRDDLINQL